MKTKISQKNFRAIVGDWLQILGAYGLKPQPDLPTDPHCFERVTYDCLGGLFGELTPPFKAVQSRPKAGLSEKQAYDIILKFAIAATRRGVRETSDRNCLEAISIALSFLLLVMGYDMVTTPEVNIKKVRCHKAFEELAKLDGWDDKKIKRARLRAKKKFPKDYEDRR